MTPGRGPALAEQLLALRDQPSNGWCARPCCTLRTLPHPVARGRTRSPALSESKGDERGSAGWSRGEISALTTITVWSLEHAMPPDNVRIDVEPLGACWWQFVKSRNSSGEKAIHGAARRDTPPHVPHRAGLRLRRRSSWRKQRAEEIVIVRVLDAVAVQVYPPASAEIAGLAGADSVWPLVRSGNRPSIGSGSFTTNVSKYRP